MTARRVAYALSLLFVFSVPWELMAESSSAGTLSKFIGLGAAGAWLISSYAGETVRHLTAAHGAVFLFVVWAGLTSFWSLDPGRTYEGVFTNVQLLVMVMLIWSVFDTRARILAALQAYVFGCYVVVGGILVSYAENSTTVYLRYSAPGADVDNTALIVALALPASFYLIFAKRERRPATLIRICNFAFLPTAVFGMVLTGTRGALIATIPAFIVMLVVLGRAGTKGRLVAVALIVVSVGAVAAYAPATLVERVTSETTEASGGTENDVLTGRGQIWRESLDAFSNRPLTGVGDNAHRAAIPTRKVAHNTLLSVLTETGLVGFLLFVSAVLAVFRLVRRSLFVEDGYWFAQLCVVVIGSLSLSTEDTKSSWIVVALAVSYASLNRSPERVTLGRSLATHRRRRPLEAPPPDLWTAPSALPSRGTPLRLPAR